VPESTSETVVALQDIVEAARAAAKAMQDIEQLAERGIERLGGGMRVADLIRTSTADQDRQSLQGAIDAIVDARHRFRLVAITACVDDGMAPKEIAEAWGISRQRVDQFIQEARRCAGG